MSEREKPKLRHEKKSPLEYIKGDFTSKDIVSLRQFDPKSLQQLFEVTSIMRDSEMQTFPMTPLGGHVVTLLFYEPSSRTFNSFDSAVKHLGGETITEKDPSHFSSVSKGETFEDTIRTFEAYGDLIVLRHPEVGSAELAAKVSQKPIINAGDGIGEHPTQALLDLFTIWEHTGRLENIRGLMAGDILNGRTVHSLLEGLAMFPGNVVYLLSHESLRLDRSTLQELQDKGLAVIEIDSPEDIPKDVGFWYWTRTQKERFKDNEEYEKVKNNYIITPKFMKKYGNPNMVLMHPLPRVGEIDPKVDDDPRAIYFNKQAQNGLYVRMALLALVLGRTRTV